MGRKVSPQKKPLPPPALCCPMSSVAVLPVLPALQVPADAPPVMRCDAAWAETMRENERQLAGWGAGRVFPDVPLWVGAHADALSPQGLESRGIRAIVNVAEECGDTDGVFYSTLQDLDQEEEEGGGGVTVLRLELADHCDAPAASNFIPCAEFVARALERGDGVLIHCRGGVSRGPTFAIASLMLLKGLNLDAALDAIRAVRPQANPNLGFTIALVEFEKQARMFTFFVAQAKLDNVDSPLSTLLQWYRACVVKNGTGDADVLRAMYDLAGQKAARCLTAALPNTAADGASPLLCTPPAVAVRA